MPEAYPEYPRVGVGVLVWRDADLLLIRRGQPPNQGEWSLPGGRQELGETLFQTAAREAMEEAGVTVEPYRVLTVVDGIDRDDQDRVRFHYTIVEVMARWLDGQAVAGSDALEVAWVNQDNWRDLVTWPPLVAVLQLAWEQRSKGQDQ